MTPIRRRRSSRTELDEIVRRLERLDARGAAGPWTRRILEVLGRQPGVNWADLARAPGFDRVALKECRTFANSCLCVMYRVR